MAQTALRNGHDGTERRTRRTYTAAEVEHALATVAAVEGHVRRASRVLAERGLEVPPSTLSRWRHEHSDIYLRIRVELVPQKREAQREALRELAREPLPA